GVENAALAIRPAYLARAKQAVEKLVRDHLGWQRPVVARPAHVPLDALAERLLRYPDLERPKPRLAADLAGNGLVDRRPARAAPGERRPGHQRAHRLVMPVAGAGQRRGGVVEPADHVNVVAERSERPQARRQNVIR